MAKPKFISNIRRLLNFNYTESLKTNNRTLGSIKKALDAANTSTNEALVQIQKDLETLRKEATLQRRHDDAMRSLATMPLFEEMRKEYRAKQLGLLETVQTVSENNLSFVRIGDGELKLAFDITANLGFQKNSTALQKDLNDAMSGSLNRDDVIFGTPHTYRDRHWSMIWAQYWPEFREVIAPAARLGNAHATRPLFFASEGEQGVEAWRSVWAGKKATIITGKSSRFDLIPQLFDNLAGSDRIDSQDRHAYADIPRIMNEVHKATDTDIFLVALGPAGTVLSHKIAETGRQAVDVGHISDSYLAVFEGGARPESRPYSQTPAKQ